MHLLGLFIPVCLLFVSTKTAIVGSYGVDGFFDEKKATVVPPNTLMADLTLVLGSSDPMAVCLDGSSPGYYLDRGSGSGANSWLIQLEGGGWCNDDKTCAYRTKSPHGSSEFFAKSIPFVGILSNNSRENPGFYKWTRVKVAYCDGASFSGDSENKTSGLHFRGQRVFRAAMKHLMSNGMQNATQALLSGCSAGGLASILHCDKFRDLFPETTKVKCLSDAGLFMDAADVSGKRTMRKLFIDVVRLHNIRKNFTGNCPKHTDRASCFFPQNLIANIKTPLFILNAAYDSWQIRQSLISKASDPDNIWTECRSNYTRCSKQQMDFLNSFRMQMLNATKDFAGSRKNGIFINSCFAHCQSESKDTWFGDDSPTVKGTSIAKAVNDWFFEGDHTEAVACESCDGSCHNIIFRS